MREEKRKAFVDFQELKRRLDIRDYLVQQTQWSPVRSSGSTWRGPCPIHGSRPRSKSFAVTQQLWYCHKCHHGGDIIRLVALLHQVTDYQAAQLLLGLV